METFTVRSDIPNFAHLAAYDEIAENDYNLSVSNYVKVELPPPDVDIQELNAEISAIVARENALRAEIDKIIAEIEA